MRVPGEIVAGPSSKDSPWRIGLGLALETTTRLSYKQLMLLDSLAPRGISHESNRIASIEVLPRETYNRSNINNTDSDDAKGQRPVTNMTKNLQTLGRRMGSSGTWDVVRPLFSASPPHTIIHRHPAPTMTLGSGYTFHHHTTPYRRGAPPAHLPTASLARADDRRRAQPQNPRDGGPPPRTTAATRTKLLAGYKARALPPGEREHHARLHARAVPAVPRSSLIIIEYEYDDRGGAAGAGRAEE
ncbi:hypothetical protein V502_02263 [Pseudogymnoascus sp. VKM F-4520 (FW-2644)]|nr:hypothetical protein V502_02263 [Pseudogymnoascus sp. VKM F-4520 (FW-2644)]